jgi:hypothetical protein
VNLLTTLASRLPELAAALLVGLLGLRWLLRGDRRGALLLLAALARSVGSCGGGGAEVAAATWWDPAAPTWLSLPSIAAEGLLAAGSWALLLAGLLLPNPTEDPALDDPLDGPAAG